MCFSIGLGWEAIFLLNQDLFVRYVFSEAKPLVLQGMSFKFFPFHFDLGAGISNVFID